MGQAEDMEAARIVAAARRWIGTGYAHRASRRGVGADCLGLLRGIWRELLGEEPEAVPRYARDWNVADGTRLRHALERRFHAVETSERGPGHVALFRLHGRCSGRHVGVLAHGSDGSPSFIHAYSKYGVVESALSPIWDRRMEAVYAFPARRD